MYSNVNGDVIWHCTSACREKLNFSGRRNVAGAWQCCSQQSVCFCYLSHYWCVKILAVVNKKAFLFKCLMAILFKSHFCSLGQLKIKTNYRYTTFVRQSFLFTWRASDQASCFPAHLTLTKHKCSHLCCLNWVEKPRALDLEPMLTLYALEMSECYL